MKKLQQFAASGNSSAPEKIIIGKIVDEITFISYEFSGTMNHQQFWDDLAEYAKNNNVYVRLMY